MRSAAYLLLPLVASVAPTALAVKSIPNLFPRQGSNAIPEDCAPHTSPGQVIPPCVSIVNIQEACTPNGTGPIFLEAHAQCMCTGSFFEDWLGCRACLEGHGLLSERDMIRYDNALGSVSSEMCAPGATPTAVFENLFSSVAASEPQPTTGDTSLVTKLGTSTDVSLYYTAPSGGQGVGSITGDATSATKTGTGVGTTSPSTTASSSESQGTGSSNVASTTTSAATTGANHSGGVRLLTGANLMGGALVVIFMSLVL